MLLTMTTLHLRRYFGIEIQLITHANEFIPQFAYRLIDPDLNGHMQGKHGCTGMSCRIATGIEINDIDIAAGKKSGVITGRY